MQLLHTVESAGEVVLANDITERLTYVKAVEEQKRQVEGNFLDAIPHASALRLPRIIGLIPLINDVAENASERGKMLKYLLQSANET